MGSKTRGSKRQWARGNFCFGGDSNIPLANISYVVDCVRQADRRNIHFLIQALLPLCPVLIEDPIKWAIRKGSGTFPFTVVCSRI